MEWLLSHFTRMTSNRMASFTLELLSIEMNSLSLPWKVLPLRWKKLHFRKWKIIFKKCQPPELYLFNSKNMYQQVAKLTMCTLKMNLLKIDGMIHRPFQALCNHKLSLCSNWADKFAKLNSATKNVHFTTYFIKNILYCWYYWKE